MSDNSANKPISNEDLLAHQKTMKSDLENKINKLQQGHSELEARFGKAEERLDAIDGELNSVNRGLRANEDEVYGLSRQYRALASRVDSNVGAPVGAYPSHLAPTQPYQIDQTSIDPPGLLLADWSFE